MPTDAKGQARPMVLPIINASKTDRPNPGIDFDILYLLVIYWFKFIHLE